MARMDGYSILRQNLLIKWRFVTTHCRSSSRTDDATRLLIGYAQGIPSSFQAAGITSLLFPA